jgi:transcriptional regulator with GAF, ATPase, and Fis domain
MILTVGDNLQVDMLTTSQNTTNRQRTLKEVERDQILFVLEKTGWRIRGKGGAAERLDIKPTTLEARMAKLGIKRPTQSTS